jgi:hypothetical protein
MATDLVAFFELLSRVGYCETHKLTNDDMLFLAAYLVSPSPEQSQLKLL